MTDHRKTIRVSERDIRPVRNLVKVALNTHVGMNLAYAMTLDEELRQATVLPPSRLPPDLVVLQSRIWATDRDSGQSMVVTLVMPHQTGASADRISILSPLGMALFGYEAGDFLDWGPVHRPIRIRLDRVRHTRQPKA